MATFENAIGTVIRHEGGYVNNPDDPGGETNFGISKRKYPNVDIAALTEQGAREIYRRDYWLPIYEQITCQPVATKVFDLAVNMGHSQAHKILQRALQSLGAEVGSDGVFGPKTLDAVESLESFEVFYAYGNEAARFYFGLARDKRPLRQFLYGWLKRAYA